MKLDGFEVSKKIKNNLRTEVELLIEQGKRVPCLAVVLVGTDAASQTYVNSKVKQCELVGFESQAYLLPEDTSLETLLSLISDLNQDDRVDGILVQLPLPKHLDEDIVINALSPYKDVDGLHPENVGLLALDQPRFIPCTPKGIMTLLKEYDIEISGKRALVIGRSRLVGKPVASLLMKENATVTIAHSKTTNLESLIAENDIIVVAIGKAQFIEASMIHDNHVLVDVGIHRIDGKIVGDVQPGTYEKAAYATPVPKGVGPMTIASLLENTMVAYKLKGE
ncbi:MAG: bifunctional 5,10-methylenetetrahydrofolate dehydrogenase/5,10-methenyltetrahydrofolate cyclohydrolase [Erysipelothrix sp.]